MPPTPVWKQAREGIEGYSARVEGKHSGTTQDNLGRGRQEVAIRGLPKKKATRRGRICIIEVRLSKAFHV